MVRGINDDISFAFYSGSTYRKGGSLYLRSMNQGENISGTFELEASNGNEYNCSLTGFPNGKLYWNNTDLAGTAIVAKSISSTGYIKYVSGLILQWGNSNMPANSTMVQVTFPISFPVAFGTSLVTQYSDRTAGFYNFISNKSDLTRMNIQMNAATKNTITFNWFAIGY